MSGRLGGAVESIAPVPVEKLDGSDSKTQFPISNSVPAAAAATPYLEPIAKTYNRFEIVPPIQGLPGFFPAAIDLTGGIFYKSLPREFEDIPLSRSDKPSPLPGQGTFHGYQLPLSACPGWASFATCINDHRFAKELVCGKEYCPICGEDWSVSHQRRFARWLPKAKQLVHIGYLVITFPTKVRPRLRNKSELSRVRRELVRYLKRYGVIRGLTRWHWFGDKSQIFNPHLNLLLDSARLDKEFLKNIRLFVASLVGCQDLVAHYQYTDEIPKMIHQLKYVTRSTFRNIAWDEELSENLYNFRNQASFGVWKDDPVWPPDPVTSKFDHIIALETHKCPICRGEGKEVDIKWDRKPAKMAFLTALINAGFTRPIGAGYHQINPQDANKGSP